MSEKIAASRTPFNPQHLSPPPSTFKPSLNNLHPTPGNFGLASRILTKYTNKDAQPVQTNCNPPRFLGIKGNHHRQISLQALSYVPDYKPYYGARKKPNKELHTLQQSAHHIIHDNSLPFLSPPPPPKPKAKASSFLSKLHLMGAPQSPTPTQQSPTVILMSFMAEQERLRAICERVPELGEECERSIHQQSDLILNLVQQIEQKREMQAASTIERLKRRIEEIEQKDRGGTQMMTNAPSKFYL